MPPSVASELAEFLMQTSQLLLACEKQHGLPTGLPLRVAFDDSQRAVSIDVRQDDAWRRVLTLDANPASPTFGSIAPSEPVSGE